MVIALYDPALDVPHMVDGEQLPCTYCRQPVPVRSFRYLSTMRRLMTASCESCDRQVWVLTSTWRRAAGRHPPAPPSPEVPAAAADPDGFPPAESRRCVQRRTG
jgi:hypothetical protein